MGTSSRHDGAGLTRPARRAGALPLPEETHGYLPLLVSDGGALLVGGEVTSPPAALRLDYAGRTDAQPVYLGKAPGGSAVGDPVWTVTKFLYESAAADARLSASDVRSGLAFADRANPTPAWTI